MHVTTPSTNESEVVDRTQQYPIFKCRFPNKAHKPEDTPHTMVLQYSNHYSAETTKAMQIECIAQEHNLSPYTAGDGSIFYNQNFCSIEACINEKF